MFSGDIFIKHVDQRNAATLLPIIRQYIRPGTTVISDSWAAYRRIGQLPEGYTHLTINHSVHFVDPETGAHTNTIESTWQKLKARHKKEYGTARTQLAEYISQHLWKKEFGGNDQFYNFWLQVREIYPLLQ